jgi:hypothetical protein
MKSTFLPLRLFLLLSGLLISHVISAQDSRQVATPSLSPSKDFPDKGVPLAVNALSIASKTYYNEGKITSVGHVEANAKVIFKSAYAIELKPGFVAELGSSFEASIDKEHTTNAITLKKGNTDVSASHVSLSHRLFPNPTADNFTLEITADTEGKAEIVIFNTVGAVQLVKPITVFKGTQHVSITSQNWASGLYLVNIKTNDTIKSERLVINKH